jgi:hypothetical protein
MTLTCAIQIIALDSTERLSNEQYCLLGWACAPRVGSACVWDSPSTLAMNARATRTSPGTAGMLMLCGTAAADIKNTDPPPARTGPGGHRVAAGAGRMAPPLSPLCQAERGRCGGASATTRYALRRTFRHGHAPRPASPRLHVQAIRSFRRHPSRPGTRMHGVPGMRARAGQCAFGTLVAAEPGRVYGRSTAGTSRVHQPAASSRRSARPSARKAPAPPSHTCPTTPVPPT